MSFNEATELFLMKKLSSRNLMFSIVIVSLGMGGIKIMIHLKLSEKVS